MAMRFKKSIFYFNIALGLVAVLLGVNAFSATGHDLIQRALAAVGNITGEGTINYIARFAGAANPSNQIGDSLIYDTGTRIGIGTINPGSTLDVNGNAEVNYLYVNPQDAVHEGGEIQLRGAAAYPSFQIDNYQGYARIHTLAPGKDFQVLGGDVLLWKDSSTWGSSFINANGSSGQAWRFVVGGSAGDGNVPPGGMAIHHDGNNSPFQIKQDGTIFMNVGNVGIGTDNPDQKLTIQGSVNIGGTGNGALNVRHINGKDWGSAANDNLYLQYNTRKDVQIGSVADPSNLIVNGGAIILTPLPADPPGLINGMMWMRQ